MKLSTNNMQQQTTTGKFSCLAQYKNVCQKKIKPSDLFYKVIVH